MDQVTALLTPSEAVIEYPNVQVCVVSIVADGGETVSCTLG
jgi:hypothetical protein